MSDITERLRGELCDQHGCFTVGFDAADEIDRLRAEVAALQQELKAAREQEPVAWRVQRTDGAYELFIGKDNAQRRTECFIRRPSVEPLYTSPVPAADAGTCPACGTDITLTHAVTMRQHKDSAPASVAAFHPSQIGGDGFCVESDGSMSVWRGGRVSRYWPDDVAAMTGIIKPAAVAVPDELVRDAERYRFQRNHMFRWYPLTGEWVWYVNAGTIGAKGTAESFEDAIDAAILAANGGAK